MSGSAATVRLVVISREGPRDVAGNHAAEDEGATMTAEYTRVLYQQADAMDKMRGTLLDYADALTRATRE